MMTAWRLYIDDNRDFVPQSYGPQEWVHGWLDLSANPSNWDINQDLVKSLLWTYCGKSPRVWKCPADTSTVRVGTTVYPGVRSIAMNAWFNSTDVEGFGPAGMRDYKKLSDVTSPVRG